MLSLNFRKFLMKMSNYTAGWSCPSLLMPSKYYVRLSVPLRFLGAVECRRKALLGSKGAGAGEHQSEWGRIMNSNWGFYGKFRTMDNITNDGDYLGKNWKCP